MAMKTLLTNYAAKKRELTAIIVITTGYNHTVYHFPPSDVHDNFEASFLPAFEKKN
jgi:hypothetical protein